MNTEVTAESATPEIGVTDIRHTPEYAAAWDLELWRVLQTSKIQKELKEREKKAMEEMKLRVQQKEKADLAQVEKRMRDCGARESALAKLTEALEKRKVKLKDLEAALRKQLDDTDAFRQRLDAETDARIARVKEEAAHKLELQHQRLVEAQEQITRSDDRAANAQKEYLKLWDEFSDFKTRMLSQSGPQLAQQLDAMRAQNEANMMLVVERYDKRYAEMQQRHNDELRAVHLELKKTSETLASKREQTKTALQAVAKLTEERDAARAEARNTVAALQQAEQVAAGLRQQLFESQTGASRGVAPHQEQTTVNSRKALRESMARAADTMQRDVHAAEVRENEAPARVAARAEIQRLTSERDSLLRNYGGVYTPDNPIVVDLERRIRAAMHFLSTDAASRA